MKLFVLLINFTQAVRNQILMGFIKMSRLATTITEFSGNIGLETIQWKQQRWWSDRRMSGSAIRLTKIWLNLAMTRPDAKGLNFIPPSWMQTLCKSHILFVLKWTSTHRHEHKMFAIEEKKSFPNKNHSWIKHMNKQKSNFFMTQSASGREEAERWATFN